MGLVHPDSTTNKEDTMVHTSTKTKALIATAGLIGLGVLTAGSASASTTPSPVTPTSVEAPDAVGTEVAAVDDGADGGHEDADGVDVTGPDDATEVAGAEVPGVDDGNDGGHQDADGVDVQNEGGASEL